MRTGSQYLESLKDGRNVIINGERVRDVTTHPAFSGVSRSLASQYDLVARESAVLTFPSPSSGQPVAIWHLMPRSQEDLKRRRIGLCRYADASYGLIGRGPDLMGSFFAGFASAPEVFARKRAEFGTNIVRFQEKMREEDLYVTCAYIPPQIDRSKTAHEQVEPNLVASVVQERDGGIVIRGAQMLATGAAISDFLHLTSVVPLRPGDEDHAISLVVPIGAPGLKLYVRRGYAQNQPSVFDYQLSCRFDETDALVVFDDVFVPWEHVFVYRDLEMPAAFCYCLKVGGLKMRFS